MSLSSPAFALNGTIPSQYTCEGTNISPPLQWHNLPAHTAELVLFIIDDGSNGSEGGIRWVVSGIDPSLSGIAAGALPAGAVVGRNSSGKAAYGGICPPKGKAVLFQFVLWALSKKLNFNTGFIPAVAEREYSSSELNSAITYAIAERR
jgi:Raf kinase inhibitor-like YbhB/YbcL family protein